MIKHGFVKENDLTPRPPKVVESETLYVLLKLLN